jgi:ricin-type beta-trefoil lectin protein/polysaccharide deacetylase
MLRLKSFHICLRQARTATAALSVAAFVSVGMTAIPAAAAATPAAATPAAATPAAATPAAATPAAAAKSPTVVSFTFDNQWESQMIAAADLKAAGMAGTFYTISGWIGLTGFLSMADLQTLVADGDEIGGKTVNNSDLPTLSDAEAEREICQGRNVLLSDGFKVTDFAYPFADLNAEDETLVKACGFNSGRGVGNVASVDPGACAYPDCPYAETIPPADPYQIATPDDAEQTTTLADMEKTVTNAENHGGGLLAFSFHQICDTSTAGCDPVYSWSPKLFSQFVTWLQGQEATGGVQVKTIAQVIGGAVQPAVTAPTVPAAAVGVNALVNPALTTADTVTPTNPECWTNDSYGTNTPSFSWSATGGDGGGGEDTVTMTGLTSGDALMFTTQDLGQCAPTVVAGNSYQLSTDYKSTVPVFFTLFGRAANGTWSDLTESPTFPASASWTPATWLTPPVASTVTALSYGMTIASNGSLSTSHYSLASIGAGVPVAAAPGVNALHNPLLQTPDGTGTNPACWLGTGYGTNTPAYTWSPTGGQAGGEETINMTSVTSGDAELITPFDNGNCAPTVTVGGIYTTSVYYKSSVPVFLTLYSRNATTGVWGYWTQSQPFPPATTWTLATFTTPAVPSTVNGASFGMTIASVGTLSTSNYSLTEATLTGPIVSGVYSGKCVDDNTGSSANGTKVQIWDCDGNPASQSWTIETNGTIGLNGKCMDITNGSEANGALVELWTCNGGANQQWQAVNGTLFNPVSGKCLDDTGYNITNGTQLELWACNGGSNQQWKLP